MTWQADMLRALWVALALLAATVLTGLLGLPLIRAKVSSQPIRHNGPKSHLAKSGTPTFGGLFFLIPLTLLGLLAPLLWKGMWPLTFTVAFILLFAGVGFADDYIKVRVSREGMSVKQKTLVLGLFSLLAAVAYLWFLPVQPFILLPLTGRSLAISGGWKFLYLAFLVPFLFYMSNSVNITDGLDGLLSCLMTIASLGLLAVAALLHDRLPLPGPIMILLASLAAGCLGFLFFNRHPARIFMGDTGSQALGIGFTLLTVLMGLPYLALVTGFVFFFEGFSVVLQVIYFKATGGRRIFRMSPIHHHFELVGWAETKVVAIFSLMGILWAGLGFLLVSGPLWGMGL